LELWLLLGMLCYEISLVIDGGLEDGLVVSSTPQANACLNISLGSLVLSSMGVLHEPWVWGRSSPFVLS